MFKTKLATFVGALVLASSSFAMKGAADECPSVGAIQSQGLTMSAQILEGMYLTYNISQYESTSTWVFLLGPVGADSDEEALEEGNELLSTLSGNPSTEEDDEGNSVCVYDTGSQDYVAIALLTDEENPSPLKLMHYLRKKR